MSTTSDESPDLVDAATKGAHRTVSRIALILQRVASSPDGLRLNDIAQALDAPKSSVHGLVKGLVEVGFLEFTNGHYVRGEGLDRITPANQRTLIHLAEPRMSKLLSTFNETVVLSTMLGDSLTYLLTMESTHPIRYVPPHVRPDIGVPSASVKIFLANVPDEQVRSYLSSRVREPDRRDAILAEIETARSTGVAYNRGDTYTGMSAAAAAIRNEVGVMACIAVGGVSARMDHQLVAIGNATLQTCDDIGRTLRATGPNFCA